MRGKQHSRSGYPVPCVWELSGLGRRMDDALLHWRGGAIACRARASWDDRYYLTLAGPPQLTLLAGCGGRVNEALRCEHGSERVEFGDLEHVRGPGLAGAGPRCARIEVAVVAGDGRAHSLHNARAARR
jgi:hypothetical protein